MANPLGQNNSGNASALVIANHKGPTPWRQDCKGIQLRFYQLVAGQVSRHPNSSNAHGIPQRVSVVPCCWPAPADNDQHFIASSSV
jgi:hypothetical protein